MLYDTKNPHGGDIYAGNIRLDFSANINPLGTPESVREAISRALPDLDRYPDPYCRALRAAIAEAEDVPEKYVICGNGAEDWLDEISAEERSKRIIEQARSGMVILLPDMEGNFRTVQALDTIIPELKKQGYTFVTVSDLFAKCGVTPQHGKIYTNVLTD